MPRWLHIWTYSPLPKSDDTADATSKTYVSWKGWPGSRRIRTRLLVGILCLVIIFLVVTFYGFLSHEQRRQPSHASAANNSTTPEVPCSDNQIDWSRFAYTQYVTNPSYLCNSIMIMEALERLRSKADRVIMYPQEWELDGDNPSEESRLLLKAQNEYKAKLVPIIVQSFPNQEKTWAESFTKLLAFNQTQYDRVLSLDSDATILQHMDELFLLPSAPVAMPRAYWLENMLSSQLVLLQPSPFEFKRIQDSIEHHGPNDFDMEIVNNLYGKSCMILPHRPYNLLSGEFRSDKHEAYLGSKEAIWDPDKIMKETKFVHFSDWPYPKPWLKVSEAVTNNRAPPCRSRNESTGEEDCRDRDTWKWLYTDFSRRRLEVCGRAYDSTVMRSRRTSPPVSTIPSRFEAIF